MQITKILAPVHDDNGWYSLTPLSDLHLDSEDCDVTALKKLIAKRNEIPGHRFIFLGDVGDWIVPSDRKRHRISNAVLSVANRDDAFAAITEYQYEVLRECNEIDLFAQGNHELSALKNHHCDPIQYLITRFRDDGRRIAHGGLSGFLRYDFADGRGVRREGLTILYHHGVWFGKADLPLGALDFASTCEGYDVFLFGHNHKLATSVRGRLRPEWHRGSDRIVARDIRIATCGTFARGYLSSTMPSFSEQRAHAPTAIGAPLIKWRRRQSRGKDHAAQYALEIEVVL